VEMAVKKGEAAVPVLYVELSAEEEALVLATLDPIGAMAGADNEKLEALLNSIHDRDADVDALLSTLAPALILDASEDRREQGQNYLTSMSRGTGFFSVGAISAPVPLALLQEAERHLQRKMGSGEELEAVLSLALHAILVC